MAPHWFGEYLSSFFPEGFFGFFVSYGVISLRSISFVVFVISIASCSRLPLASGRPEETKIKQMDDIRIMSRCS